MGCGWGGEAYQKECNTVCCPLLEEKGEGNEDEALSDSFSTSYASEDSSSVPNLIILEVLQMVHVSF